VLRHEHERRAQRPPGNCRLDPPQSFLGTQGGAMRALLFSLLLGAQTVTLDDVQRIQDSVNTVSNDLVDLRRSDSSLAGQLEGQLDQVRDEVAYLRVKLRRNEPIERGDYADVRSRLDDIGRRARGQSVRESTPDQVTVGTEFEVRLQSSLSSRTARVEDRFNATTVA